AAGVPRVRHQEASAGLVQCAERRADRALAHRSRPPRLSGCPTILERLSFIRPMHTSEANHPPIAWQASVDLDALRTFLAIHRAAPLPAAAGELFRSQPAVSRRLALLEAGLGAPLFERVPGGLVLSEAGHALLPFAEKMLATLTDAEAAVRAVRAEDTGPV